MLIDWFTVVAQALNFLVLVWLMKRFLYKPILHAIDEREKRIAGELAEADAGRAEAQRERDEYREKTGDFDRQKAALLKAAQEEVQSERDRLLDQARTEADALGARRRESMANEARSLNRAITRRIQDEVFAIARKALTDLAATNLEERMVEVFILRLRGLDGEAKHQLAEALKTSTEPALVRGTHDLTAEQRAAIQHALNETFASEVRVRFETAPDLVSGIEFVTNGKRVAWSIGDYLESLEQGVRELQEGKGGPGAKAAPRAEEARTEPDNP